LPLHIASQPRWIASMAALTTQRWPWAGSIVAIVLPSPDPSGTSLKQLCCADHACHCCRSRRPGNCCCLPVERHTLLYAESDKPVPRQQSSAPGSHANLKDTPMWPGRAVAWQGRQPTQERSKPQQPMQSGTVLVYTDMAWLERREPGPANPLTPCCLCTPGKRGLCNDTPVHTHSHSSF
jgi:hypothetical protein